MPELPRVRFPWPPSEPAVRLSTQRALHECHADASVSSCAARTVHGVGIA
ncbi:hypothetical protein GL309_37750 [Nocardia seriolae]|nr:hypothetical protein [Nocardia seriolae]MTK43961.1 hypothetical protein [Nocardia seriolae]